MGTDDTNYEEWERPDLARELHRRGGNPYRIPKAKLAEMLRAYDEASTPEGREEAVAHRAATACDDRLDSHVEDLLDFPTEKEPLPTAQLLARVTAQIGQVAKTGHNREQNYNFRQYDDILAAVRRPLAEAGVALLPSIVRREEHEHTTRSGARMARIILTVRYRFIGPVDELEAEFVGEGMDNLDKATSKAMTQSTKYLLSTMFLISSTDDEPDAGHGQGKDNELTPRSKPPLSAGWASLDEETEANRLARKAIRDLPEATGRALAEKVASQGYAWRDPWPRTVVDGVWADLTALRGGTGEEGDGDGGTPTEGGEGQQQSWDETGEEPT